MLAKRDAVFRRSGIRGWLLLAAVTLLPVLVIAAGGPPAGNGSAPDGHRQILAVDESRNQILRLDQQGIQRFDLSSGGSLYQTFPGKPRSLALDSINDQLLVLDQRNLLHFLELETLQPYHELRIRPTTGAIAVDGQRRLALLIEVPGREMRIIDTESAAELGVITTRERFVDMAVHSVDGKVLVIERGRRPADADQLVMFDLISRERERSWPLGGRFNRIVLDETLGRVVLAGDLNDELLVLDYSSGEILQRHPLPVAAGQLQLQSLFHLVVVRGADSGYIAVADLEQHTVTPVTGAPSSLDFMAVSQRYNSLVLSDVDSGPPVLLPLPSPSPQLTSLQPTDVRAGADDLTLQLTGERFVDGAELLVDEQLVTAEWHSHQQLEAVLPADLLAEHRTLHVAVVNPEPQAGASNSLPFDVIGLNPLPQILSLQPEFLLTSNYAEELELLGEGFVEDSTVHAGGVSLLTSYLAEDRLRVTVPQPLLETPGQLTLTVFNPEPGGGLSNAAVLEVIGAPPQIHKLSPESGMPGTLLRIEGDFFDALSAGGNQIAVGGVPAVVAAASKTELTVVVPLAAESGPVTVVTASGSAESPMPFTVSPRENFDIEPSQSDVTIPLNGEGGVVVSLTNLGLADYAGMVELDLTSLPPGVTASYSHGRLSLHQPTVITLRHDGSAQAGEYVIGLRASGSADGREQVRDIELTLRLLPPDTTTVSGRVLHTEDGSPFVGARVQLGDQFTSTDGSGRYLFVDPALSGDQVVIIDGQPRNTDAIHYASRIPMPVMIESGEPNRAMTAYLAAVDASSYTDIVPGQAASVTVPELPNYELRIPQGAVLVGWDGELIERINVRMIPPDRLPIRPVPEGISTRSVYLYYFFQPGGAEPSEPIPVTMNNDLGLLPGEKATLWYYDEMPEPNPDSNQWRIMGAGTVSADGQSIVSDPGVGIPRFCCGATFASPANPPDQPPGGDGGGACAGNPVDLASGIGSVVSPLNIGLPGMFSPTIDMAYSPLSQRNGAFGVGTWLNSDWRLYAGSASSTVSTPSGVRYILVRQSDGIYRAESGRARGFGMELSRSGGIATLRFGDGRKYEFSTGGALNTLLLAETDASGNRITYSRETVTNSAANGRLLEVRDSRNRRYLLSYVSTTRVGTITDPLGRVQTFDYDTNGRLIRVTDYAGHVTQYTWNSDNRVVEKRDAAGGITQYGYDDAGRTISQQLADGGQFRFDYRLVGDTVIETDVTNPRGQRHNYRFNAQGYLTRTTDALGQSSERRYDSRTNFLRSQADALGRVTRFTYDDRGNRSSWRDHRDRTTLIDYHPRFDKPVRIRDPLGRETFLAYTHDGNLRDIINAAGESTQISYTSEGLPATVTDALGNRSEFFYDDHGNLTLSRDPLGNTLQMAYDQANRLVKQTDSLGRTTRYHYDVLDRIIRIEDARGGHTDTSYDPRGRLESVRDPKGALIESNSYDKRGRLTLRENAGGQQWHYSYDANGNLTRYLDPNEQEALFDYDALDRLIRQQDADGRETRYHYDAAGRLVRVVDSISGETRYEYDDLDRLIRELTDRGMVEYAYDDADQLIERRINGIEVTTYQYDPAGRVTHISHNGRTAEYHWDQAGRLIEKRLPNNIRQLYNYDAASQLQSIEYLSHSGDELERIDYSYDPAGQRIGRNQAQGISVSETPFTATYDADNRMLSYNGHALSYDANGNLTQRETESGPVIYTWNSRNQLIAIGGPNGSAAFEYDHMGRRISKTINGNTTQYLYHGMQAVAELQDSAIGAVYHTGLMIDEVLARYAASGDRILLADALGSVIALADEDGEIKTRYGYSAFGESESSGEESDNPLAYTGREDDGTGLYYYRARYYDPGLKRFISSDPIGLAGGVNIYAYVLNDPVSWIDPGGLRGGRASNVWNRFQQLYSGRGLSSAQKAQIYRQARLNEQGQFRNKELHDAMQNLPERSEAIVNIPNQCAYGACAVEVEVCICNRNESDGMSCPKPSPSWRPPRNQDSACACWIEKRQVPGL